jgi:hypothetical protein
MRCYTVTIGVVTVLMLCILVPALSGNDATAGLIAAGLSLLSTGSVLTLWVREAVREFRQAPPADPPSNWERLFPLRGRWLRLFCTVLLIAATAPILFMMMAVLAFALATVGAELYGILRP